MNKFSLIDYLSLFLLAFVITITFFTFVYPPTARLDFGIYLLALNLAKAHKPLYPLLLGTIPFSYPPSILPFLLPFTLLPEAVAISIWNSISLVCLLSTTFLILKLHGVFLKTRHLLLLLSALLLLEPVRETLLFGQNNIVVLFFLILSFFFSQKNTTKYQLFSGISLGIAASLKVFPLFLLFYFICKKQWSVVIVTGGIFISSLFIGTFGDFHYITEYLTYASMVVTPLHTNNTDQSFSSFFLFYFPTFSKVQSLVTLCTYMVFLTMSFLSFIKRESTVFSDFLFFSFILGGTILIITPLAWGHHLVFLLPLCLALLLRIFQTKKKKDGAIFLLVFLLLFINANESNLLLHNFSFSSIPIPLEFHALLGLGIALSAEFLWFSKCLDKQYT